MMVIWECWPIQFSLPRPNGRRKKFRTPNVVSRMVNFQTSAAAVGMTRNGLMISVRRKPRPNTWRLSSSAMPMPNSTDAMTGTTVRSTVLTTAVRKMWSWKICS